MKNKTMGNEMREIYLSSKEEMLNSDPFLLLLSETFAADADKVVKADAELLAEGAYLMDRFAALTGCMEDADGVHLAPVIAAKCCDANTPEKMVELSSKINELLECICSVFDDDEIEEEED